MIRHFNSILCIVLGFAICVSISACGHEPQAEEDMFEDIPVINTNLPDALTLWCLADNPFAPMIQQFANEYSMQPNHTRVICTAFSREEDLTGSLEYEKPDMILYNDLNSFKPDQIPDFTYADRIPESIFYPSVIQSVRKSGNAFFPLGAETYVLAVNRFYWACSPTCYEIGTDVFSTLESFTGLANAYGLAGEGAFYSSDAFTDIIFTLMRSLGEDFSARAEETVYSDNYRYIYNLLAENALCGSLAVSDSSSVIDMGLGNLVCSLISSADAARIDSNQYDFYPIPLPAGSSPVCLGIMNTIGITTWNAANLPYITDFIAALFSDSYLIADTALKNGYIPTVYYSQSASKGTLVNTLCSMAESYDQILITSDTEYASNRDSFEANYRKYINILN